MNTYKCVLISVSKLTPRLVYECVWEREGGSEGTGLRFVSCRKQVLMRIQPAGRELCSSTNMCGGGSG